MKQTEQYDPKLLDAILAKHPDVESLFGKDGLVKGLTKAVLERAMTAELTSLLGYEKHSVAGNKSGNSRNGHSKKQLLTEAGKLELDIPRDRAAAYEPQILPKHKRRLAGLDSKIISLYARGMTTRDIQGQLEELYDVDVSPTLISQVTNDVKAEVSDWQSRALEKVYPLVWLDALRIKVQQDGRVINKAFYLALGIRTDGDKELLGIWVSENEGSKFWLHVLTELKNRGVDDILIACVDGLIGFPDAIEAVYPNTQVQLCIVHMLRNSLKYVSWKDRKALCADLKLVYQAATVTQAAQHLDAFADKWDKRYPTISASWRKHWDYLTPFFAYPAQIRKVMYTTNAIESLNGSLRRVLKNKRVFPSDDAALKLLYLALNTIAKKWTQPIFNWKEAMNQFIIMHGERLSAYL